MVNASVVAEVRVAGFAVNAAAPELVTVINWGFPFASRLLVIFVFNVTYKLAITLLPDAPPEQLITIFPTFSARPVAATWAVDVPAVLHCEEVCAAAGRPISPSKTMGAESRNGVRPRAIARKYL